MPEQAGMMGPDLYGQGAARFLPRDVAGPSSMIHVISYEVSGTMDTNSLTRVVLATRKIQIPIVNLSVEVSSSAIAPGGANVNIGVYKNGVLQGSLVPHNVASNYLSRTFSVLPGDLVTIEGYTDNVGVTLRLTNLSIWKAISVPPARSGQYLDGLIQGGMTT